MEWVLIAITSGMLMTGQYQTEEACLGRKAMLEKDKITNVKCINMPDFSKTKIYNGNFNFCNNGVCQ